MDPKPNIRYIGVIKVVDKCYVEHADYANLVTRRDTVEHMMDAFEVMKVR